MGKSAQFLLHTWLPDAMEGPTPVSALIHAATMVTAGVFMVARLSPMFDASPTALAFVFTIGAITAFFAATIGLVQNDIKRVIAYSTCSQLGYMFVALGAGVYSVGIFHLFTHAFFKALLFLGAGSVIHAMHHEQDMRKMGGLRKKIPATYWLMIIGSLALTGVGIPGTGIGFAGFLSKDAIIESAYSVGGNLGTFGFWSLTIAAAFTSFYSWRLIHLTFHGEPGDILHQGAPAVAHGDEHNAHDEPEMSHPEEHGHGAAVVAQAAHGDHVAAHEDHGHAHGSAYDNAHESPPVMMVPLYILGAGAVFAGMVFAGFFFANPELVQHFFGNAVAFTMDRYEAAHSVPFIVSSAATIAMIVGFLVAWYMYMVDKTAPARLAATNRGLYLFLLNKWYFDELYDRIFVRPAFWIGTALWKGFDDWLVDETIVEGLGHRVKDVTGRVVRLQSGYLYHYAFVMLIGIALLLTWVITTGGLLG
jgi:NADH-quinone oxidoreductase subunit L